jgi:hypothetical protein
MEEKNEDIGFARKSEGRRQCYNAVFQISYEEISGASMGS